MSDAALARAVAEGAGRALCALRTSGLTGSELRDEGDRRAHNFIADALATARPGDSVLSEEGKDDLSRTAADRVWIVDPLDGTREYGELDRDDWAVHVALWAHGLLAGAVALPAMGEVLCTDAPPPLPSYPTEVVRIAVSRSRPPALVGALVERLEAAGRRVELVPMGSAGRKVCAVVRGEVDAYVHAGGQYEWDSAAPVAVARATGLHTSRIDGSPLVYNAANPWLPDLVVAHPELAPELLAVLEELAVPGTQGEEKTA